MARPIENLESMLAKIVSQFVPHAARFYFLKHEGVSSIDGEKAAVIAVKHQSIMDFLFAAYIAKAVVKRQPLVLVKKEFFENRLMAKILEGLGAVPVIRKTSDDYKISKAENIKMVRTVLKALDENRWVVYCPEGTRVQGKIGEDFYAELLVLAAKKKVDIHVAGINYQTAGRYNLPLHTPFTRVTLTCEPYRPYDQSRGLKSDASITAEVQSRMADLSGLERRVVSHQK